MKSQKSISCKYFVKLLEHYCSFKYILEYHFTKALTHNLTLRIHLGLTYNLNALIKYLFCIESFYLFPRESAVLE